MMRKIIHWIVAIVLLVGIVGGVAAWLTVRLIPRPLAEADLSQLFSIDLLYHKIDEGGTLRSQFVDYHREDPEAEEILSLLDECSYRKGFARRSADSGLTVLVLAGDTFAEAQFTSLAIGRDGTVRIGNGIYELVGGEETSAKLLEALLTYLPAEAAAASAAAA